MREQKNEKKVNEIKEQYKVFNKVEKKVLETENKISTRRTLRKIKEQKEDFSFLLNSF